MLVYFIRFVFVIGCSPSKKELYEKTDAFIGQYGWFKNSI